MWLGKPSNAERQTVHVFLQVRLTKKCWRKKSEYKAVPKKGRKRKAFHKLELDTEVELKKTQSKKSRTVNKGDCSKPKRSRKLPATAKAKTCDDSVFYCIYCRELFTKPPTETWVQCSRCMQWCHESCAPIEPSDKDFVCDYCDN